MKKMNKKMLAVVLSLLPDTALANFVEQALGSGTQAIVAFTRGRLLPEIFGYWPLGLLASALTLSWMIGFQQIRKVIGKYLGPLAVIGFVVDFVGNFGLTLIIGLLKSLSWQIYLVLGLLLFFGSSAILSFLLNLGKDLAKGAVKSVWGKFKDESKASKPNWLFIVLGAIVLSGYLNTQVSTRETNYAVSMLSCGGGIAFWVFYIWFRGKCPKCEKRGKIGALCPNCEVEFEAPDAESEEHHDSEHGHHDEGGSHKKPDKKAAAHKPAAKKPKPAEEEEAPPTPAEAEACPNCHEKALGENFCTKCGHKREKTPRSAGKQPRARRREGKKRKMNL